MKQNTIHANRGQALETAIEHTCAIYRSRGLGLIQKIATPMRQTGKTSGESRVWRERSTVDFIGVYKGIPVAFDAKETGIDRYVLAALKAHQADFLADFTRAGGVGFVLASFRHHSAAFALAPSWALACADGLDAASIPIGLLRSATGPLGPFSIAPGSGCVPFDFGPAVESFAEALHAAR